MATARVHSRLAELKRDIRRELQRHTSRSARSARSSRLASWSTLALAAFLLVLQAAIIIALPFLVYVRASVELYSRGVTPWLAVVGGALLTLGIVAGYAAWLSRRLSGHKRVVAMSKWVAVPVVALWFGYSLLHLSSSNAKSDEVRTYYTSLHPALRVALSTVILADPELVVTDMRRRPEDYTRMGLPINERTMHYRQSNGWVHAVDLRTRERGAIENASVQFYFWSMGFRTLRHVGTADHLHVSLGFRE